MLVIWVYSEPDWESSGYLRNLIRNTRTLSDNSIWDWSCSSISHKENLKAIMDEKVSALQVYWGECMEELVLEAHLSFLIMFATNLGAIALSVYHNKRVHAWVTTVATILSMLGFGAAIGAAMCIARQRLASLKWSVILLQVRKAELSRDVEALVKGFVEYKIYLSISHYQTTTKRPRHEQGQEFYLETKYSAKVRSILSSSAHMEDLTSCYKTTMWSYRVVALV